MLKVALCCILFVWFWTPLYGVQLPKVSKLKRELSDQQMGFEEELAQQHKPLMNMKHGLGREKREEDAPQTCSEVKKSEVILMNGVDRVPSYCEIDPAGAEWTVFQRRVSDSVSFDRNWIDYKMGFGNMAGNFWWGNDNLAAFTANGSFVLRVDVKDADGNAFYAEYPNFYIENEDAKYRLHVGEYTGNISSSDQMDWHHNGYMFSTPDQDNDKSYRHCALLVNSGWWFNGCLRVNLNGVYTIPRLDGTGIVWHDGTIFGWATYKWTEMKFRSM